ncbi:MAG: hypothetical protein ACKPKO_09165, partial [Candidatus Fonsibacter sp.]
CKPRNKELKVGAKNWARVPFRLGMMHSEHAKLEPFLVHVLCAQGAERLVGPAPKGSLERDAKRLLERLGR